MPPKAATFWNKTKKFDSKNIEINEMVTCFFTGVQQKYIYCVLSRRMRLRSHFLVWKSNTSLNEEHTSFLLNVTSKNGNIIHLGSQNKKNSQIEKLSKKNLIREAEIFESNVSFH